MDEFEVRDELVAKRKDIHSFEDLVKFLEDVKTNYNCGYGAAPRAMAQACLAVGWYLADEFGITGFQAGFVMWDFIRDWMFSSNKCGLKIIDYDDMLYPQYDHKYEKVISSGTWKNLQEEAANRLAEKLPYGVHPAVVAHWKSIVDGKIPFGYVVKDD